MSESRAALDYSLVEETVSRRHGKKGGNLACTARLAGYGHIAGITTEIGDIVPHPLQGLHYILHTEVHGIGEDSSESRQVGISKKIETVVEGDGDYVSLLCKRAALIARKVVA